MGENAIELIDVSKRFRIKTQRRQTLKERAVRGPATSHRDGFWALRHASITIPKGSTFGLVGPNGAGKSTALKVMAGIYRPTQGAVHIDGRLSALLELGAGFHPELSGRENIALNASILGLSPLETDQAMEEIIDFADLGDHIDAPVKVYSSGMYVRLGFAIAVAVRPEILVIDEVIAVGDERFQRKCFDHLHELRSAGSTVVIVSHSMAVIEDMCDQAVWIDGGQVQLEGSGREVVRAYLDSVNLGDSVRDESTGLVHRGTGEALVNDLVVHTDDGGPVITGRPLTFEMTYECREELHEAIFAVNIVHESGVRVACPSTHVRGMLEVPVGPGEVRLRIPSCPLQPGRYRLSATIVDSSRFVDDVAEQFDLVVRPSGGLEAGLVQISGEWSVSGTWRSLASEAAGPLG